MGNKKNRGRKKYSRHRMKFISKYGKLYSAIKVACEKEKNCSIRAKSHAQADKPNTSDDDQNRCALIESCFIKVEEPMSDSHTLENHDSRLEEPSAYDVLEYCDIKLEASSESNVLESCDIKLEESSASGTLQECDIKLEVASVSSDHDMSSYEEETARVNAPGDKVSSGPAQVRLNLALSNCQDSQMLVNIENPWMKFIRDDKQLKSATGIESFKLLRAIVGWMKNATLNKYETDSAVMKTEDRVVMTYLKLKQNLKYNFLALMFDHVTKEQCEHIIQETLITLSKCMETVIQWLPRTSVFSNLPQCFQTLRKIRVIIECIQISIEIQKKQSCYDATHFSTIPPMAKAIFGISPAGVITFLSSASRGNWKESFLFEVSNLPQLLEFRDNVIVSEDFPLELMTKEYKFNCIKSPLRVMKKPSHNDLALHHEIRKAREIIDKVHGKMKEFQILNNLPSELIVFLDHILMIIAGTFNLSTPILSKDELIDAK